MRLLIITQVVDIRHPILGFFHIWVEEFAKNCESVEVICLEKGEYSLPENVTIHSLGKENLGKEKKFLSRLHYIMQLNILSWKLRKDYDAVFVHMNPEYVLAGFFVWKILRKQIGLWYTHGSVSRILRIAELFVGKIFTAADEGCNLVSKKVIVTGHGVAMSHQCVNSTTKDIDLITVGRISASKNIETLVDVLVEIQKTRPNTNFTIVGTPVTEEEKQYAQKLENYIHKKNMTNSINFVGVIPNLALLPWFARSKVFVHAATNGSLDKALLEPLASSVPLITSAPGARSLPLDNWQVHSISEFAQRILEILKHTPTDRMEKLRAYVVTEHSVVSLIPKICYHYR